jgi:hypothetical protein
MLRIMLVCPGSTLGTRSAALVLRCCVRIPQTCSAIALSRVHICIVNAPWSKLVFILVLVMHMRCTCRSLICSRNRDQLFSEKSFNIHNQQEE